MPGSHLWQNPAVKRRPLAAVAGLIVVGALAFSSGGLAGFGSPGASVSPGPGSTGVASVPSRAPVGSSATISPTAAPSISSATPTPTPTVLSVADVPVVPVAQFRSTRTATNADQVAAILLGTSERYEALELVEADADAILGSLGLAETAADAAAGRLVLAPDAATLISDLAKHRKRLAFLRASDVTPAVRALTWDGVALFGNRSGAGPRRLAARGGPGG